VKNDEDKPLLFEAVDGGASVDLIKALVQAGANFKENTKSGGIIHECVEWERPQLLDFFITKGADVDAFGKKKNSPIHIAAKKNNPILVEKLLKAKAKHSPKNKAGETPLWKLLAQENHKIKEVLSLLVKAGADPNEQDEDGNTGLHRICASEGTLLDTVRARSLLEVGARTDVKNRSGKIPIEVLEEDFEGSAVPKERLRKLLTDGVTNESDAFRIFVKTMSGIMYSLDLPKGGETSIMALKQAIFEREVVPPEDNLLKLGSTLLDNDSATLNDYQITNEDAVLSILLAKR
jgi:hypothetical protein